jgi:cytochrome c oxidase assembly factor CtaG
MDARIAMRQLFSLGSLILFLFFLTGIWVFISPFAMTTQPSGIHWIPSTINNVAVGGVLMIVSLFGILAYMVLGLRDIIREAQAKQVAEQEVSKTAVNE